MTEYTSDLWRIRSAENGNPLGCVNAASEQDALAAFAAEMAPIVLDVYAEPYLAERSPR